ncbi:MAG: type II toxin-antitoxin system RatA family toxin [Gammaproteobacteria bacterium]|nr:type II toxin-antitoxin system RatA family toxin [Gammaproteobacteria bacterium]
MPEVKRSALVPYSADEMYALVADIPRYGEFLKWCRGTEVLSDEGGILVASVTIDYHGLHKTFTTRNQMEPCRAITMELVEGPFSHLQGVWRFEALDEQASKIELDMKFGFKNRVMAALVGKVFMIIADSQVDAFHKRAEELYGKR